MFLDKRFLHPFRQLRLGKFIEGTRERRLGWQLLAVRKSANATQRTVNGQALNEANRRRQFQDRLGDKGIRQLNNLLELWRQAVDFIPQLGNQVVLNHIPSLQDQIGSGSIHLVGVVMLTQKLHHASNGRPHLFILLIPAIKSPRTMSFAKGSIDIY